MDEDGIRSVIGRIDHKYGTLGSLFLTKAELAKLTDANARCGQGQGTNGKIKRLPGAVIPGPLGYAGLYLFAY